MPCFHPIKAYQAQPGAPLTFPKSGASNLTIPCSRCIGCRLERSKQTAIRLMHEAQLHEANSFITLTYENQHLSKPRDELEDSPSRGRRPHSKPVRRQKRTSKNAPQALATEDSLSKRDAQLFVKRLRYELTTKNPSTRVKYYLVGEYGDTTKRPHFHACIFGEEFADDRVRDRQSPSGQTLYRSPTLEKAWPFGYSSIGDLTFESAAYVARYCMKKITGPMAETHYERLTTEGERYWITPEFALMSRGGRKGKGIAHGWFQKYGTDTYPNDFVVMNGHQHKPPRYYDKLNALLDQEGQKLIALERQFEANRNKADNTPARLRAKEQVALARAQTLKRHL